MTNRITRDEDITVLALARGCERYIILHTDSQRVEVLRQLQAWIDEPELSFSVMDGANLLRKMAADEKQRAGR
jgi:hypothetical protein